MPKDRARARSSRAQLVVPRAHRLHCQLNPEVQALVNRYLVVQIASLHSSMHRNDGCRPHGCLRLALVAGQDQMHETSLAFQRDTVAQLEMQGAAIQGATLWWMPRPDSPSHHSQSVLQRCPRPAESPCCRPSSAHVANRDWRQGVAPRNQPLVTRQCETVLWLPLRPMRHAVLSRDCPTLRVGNHIIRQRKIDSFAESAALKGCE